MVSLSLLLLFQAGNTPALASAIPCTPRDPFKVLDPQNWVNPDAMTWADYVRPPGTNWTDPSRRGSARDFRIALVTLDYSDRPFVVTQPAGATVFGNPQPSVSDLARVAVPAYYRDLLNTPSELNGGHTLHEYWMEDSGGRFGVNLEAFGPYMLPNKSYQYGLDPDFNPGACPGGEACGLDIRVDGLAAWRADVGNETASRFELVFILSSGQDESSTWQEFGEMKFATPQDVPDSFGPPTNGTSGDNYARTRYVPWTSWAAASTLWPNAGGGSSTQGESSGMAVYAHELSHLLNIGDNYNNPYGTPLRRAYTGPWSMMSRGSFLGPGGPHTRWKIPALQGSSQGSLHTVRDKLQLGLAANESVLRVSREGLAASGLVVATFTARSVDPGTDGLMGMKVSFGSAGDMSPACSVQTDVYCDGGGYNAYFVEVVDRMGSDSFQMDSGVLLSKSKDGTRPPQPFQWVVDANPQDIGLVDFVRPNGSVAMITLGDYRQLGDALFHAGTRSGSEFEYVDAPNRLHFYVLERHRDAQGALAYTVAVRSLDGAGGTSAHGVTLAPGVSSPGKATGAGLTCFFELGNNGTYVLGGGALHPQDLSKWLMSDVYRLGATVDGAGWRVELPNALASAKSGGSVTVRVAVGASADAADQAVVRLRAVSESNGEATASATCKVVKS